MSKSAVVDATIAAIEQIDIRERVVSIKSLRYRLTFSLDCSDYNKTYNQA